MTRFGYPTYSGRDSATKSGTPSTPGARNSAQNGSSGNDAKTTAQRKAEKLKKWPLRPWDTDDTPDDGIVGWTKRHTMMENKKDITTKMFADPKKRPAVLDAEFYVPVNHMCPSIEDIELFRSQSLHPVHLPKQKPGVENEPCGVKVKYSKSNIGMTPTHATPVGLQEQVEENTEIKDGNNNRDIDSYRDSKHTESGQEKIRDAVDNQTRLQLERSNTYASMKMKRLIKLSSNDRKAVKTDDEEDEGYSSKTSSAEIKHGGMESDGEDLEGQNLMRPDMQRMYSSMVDLSELPSHTGEGNNGENVRTSRQDHRLVEEGGRVKFSYTHQPTILQLPDPDVKLAHDSLRIERRIESEDSNWSYAKLKRNKELNRCYQPEMLQPQAEETTMYNIDSMKPVTLVLRKISIQNAGREPSVTQCCTPEHAQTSLSNNLGLGSNPPSRAGSVVDPNDSGLVSRPASAIGTTGSPGPAKTTPRNNSSPHCNTPANQRKYATVNRASSAVSQRELRHSNHRNNVRDVRVVNDGQSKEPMWNHQYSYVNRQAIDGQATNYSIGDLLPAVDKNIYSSHPVMGKYGQDDTSRDDKTTTEILDMNKTAIEDGYILLKKGMDMLAGSTEKRMYSFIREPTLGPPPFRPNQTRHPLMRNMTVIVSNKHGNGYITNPVSGSKTNGVKTSSDKGPRHVVDEDLQTQKKLKEAFSQFYRNRPKEIGKEFRRMQTMWKT